MYTSCIALLFSTSLMVILEQASGMKGIGRACHGDEECRAYNTNLRCYSKPGLVEFVSRRCQCRSRWRYRGGECRPPAGWEEEERSDPPPVDYVSVLTPAVLLSSATLIISVCACYYIHTGNRELHRQLKSESQASGRQLGNKYRAVDQPHIPPPPTPQTELADSESDGDEDDRPPAPVEDPVVSINMNEIETVSEEKPEEVKTTVPASLSGSRLSVRSLEGRRSGLHPLNGLMQPTGLVPGYQANMRLLFTQRPASAVSLAAGLTSQHFVMKSRPSSAISRISTTARRASVLSSDGSINQTDLRSQPQTSAQKPVEVSRKSLNKQQTGQSANGQVSKGPVKNGIVKLEPPDSDSNCSKSSVRFSSGSPKKQVAAAPLSSGKSKV